MNIFFFLSIEFLYFLSSRIFVGRQVLSIVFVSRFTFLMSLSNLRVLVVVLVRIPLLNIRIVIIIYTQVPTCIISNHIIFSFFFIAFVCNRCASCKPLLYCLALNTCFLFKLLQVVRGSVLRCSYWKKRKTAGGFDVQRQGKT